MNTDARSAVRILALHTNDSESEEDDEAGDENDNELEQDYFEKSKITSK